MPILRALWLHYPEDEAAVARGDEYLWGRDILVAPVVEKGATSRRLYLPRGIWYDFWTGDRIQGPREYDRAVDLNVMPLFVRAGALVPLGPVKQFVSEPIDAPPTIQVYPGADGRFVLYEDDGTTFDYQRGDWMGLELLWTDRQRRLDVRLADGSRMRPPDERRIRVQIAGASSARDVIFSGKPIEVRL
jgi:alpha-glucosidase/alpha-D-xyloside xylohydrolase